MLDIHPPEHTPHTWRDFFIHIATIVVGLCIAIGLEQAVVFVHHRVQRHELIRQLTEEATSNAQKADQALDSLSAYRRWTDAAYRQLLATPDGAPLILPLFPSVHMDAPQKVEWQSALNTGEVDVLPPAWRDRYALAYLFYDTVVKYAAEGSEAYYNLDTVLGPVPRTNDGSFDLTSLNSEQRMSIQKAIVAVRTISLGELRQGVYLEGFSIANEKATLLDETAWHRNAQKKIDALFAAHPEIATHLETKP